MGIPCLDIDGGANMAKLLLVAAAGALLIGGCIAVQDEVVKRAEYEYVNEYDQPFEFKCKEGQSIDNIATEHSNHHEDRRWDFTCKANKVITKDCSWTGEVNGFDQTFDHKCDKGVIAGIASHHNNHYEDRVFKFYCCKTTRVLKGCLDTDWINNWDEKFTAQVAKDMVLVGMYSIHENYYDDRRFKLHYCKAPSSSQAKGPGPAGSKDKGEAYCKRHKSWCSQIGTDGKWASYMETYCPESCKKFKQGTEDKGCVDKVTDCRAFRNHCLKKEINPVYTSYVKKNCCAFCKKEAEKAKRRNRPYYG